MTLRAEVRIDTERRLGAIDPGIYGQFIEHVGRAIYGGVFEPGSGLADDAGYRLDVVDAARELRPHVLRWPGGNFASGYHWRDGVGPVDERPTRRDLAWNTLESNRFGTEEFLELCRRLGAAPYLNLNLSTGTLDEALSWLEYCNASDPLPEVALRQAGPHPEPHGVPIWGLGNENYGWWQHGHTTADRYAEMAREWGKLLRWADPAVRLVGVGAPDPDWNWTVLQQAGKFIDWLSVHSYWSPGQADEYDGVVTAPLAAEELVTSTWGMCLAARKLHGLREPVRIAVDEWGVWYHSARPIVAGLGSVEMMRQGLSARSGIDTNFEESYDLKDALAVATWLHVMWRHPEKVTLATQAQMVNVIAPIQVGPDGLVRHTVFHPLALARAFAGDVALDTHVLCDEDVAAPNLPSASAPALDAGATLDSASGRVHLSLVNRHRTEELEVTLRGVGGAARIVRLAHDDPFAGNTLAAPTVVVPEETKVDDLTSLVLPPHSHTTVAFA